MVASKPRFTAKQGQYLAFIHTYVSLHRRAPAEADIQLYFRVYALDAALTPRSTETGDDLLNDMSGHVLAEGTLAGRFSH